MPNKSNLVCNKAEGLVERVAERGTAILNTPAAAACTQP